MNQFKIGYIVDSISQTLINHFQSESIFNTDDIDNNQLNNTRGLLKYLSSCDIEFNFRYKEKYNQIHPVIAVLNNIISRGLPTKAPIILEEKFVEIGLVERINSNSEMKYSKSTKELKFHDIFELMHLIEPGLLINKHNYGGTLGSHLEWKFLNKHAFFLQILQSQRDFTTLNPNMVGGKSTDFSFTSPYLHWNPSKSRYENKTRIFEVDGPHHLQNEYLYYDNLRDNAANEEDIETLRFSMNEIHKDEIKFEKLIEKNLYTTFSKNFERDFKEYLHEYSLLLIPIAVSRIQKALLECLIQKEDLFQKKEISIALIERDIPGGAIAIKNLQQYFNNLNNILSEENNLILPEIKLSIFPNDKWVIDNRLHCDFHIENEIFFNNNDFDIIIDNSILKRSNIYKEKTFNSKKAIIIRSSHYYDATSLRKIYCSNLLKYKTLVNRNSDGSYSSIKNHEGHINFFIQNVFRKKGFREGQLPIISRALGLQPVIGLLPTGGGKSLTFQLPVFLQPGLCIIIDPIKSLMADQVRVLKENWIDCCDYINSTIKPAEKRQRIIDFRLGETLMLFVSPERFVMQDFRNVLLNINKSKFNLAFSFCVIDEVHCVSEWGHDFRTTYLMLGRNAQKFCVTRNEKQKVTLLGLTATASFDVLADIERELQIEHNDVANAIVMIENTIRPELFFNVIDVTNKSRIDVLNQEFLSLSKRLTYYNSDVIIEKSEKHHFEEFDRNHFSEVDNEGRVIFKLESEILKIDEDLSLKSIDDFSTIVFCPVKGTAINQAGEFMNRNGVRFVHQKLSTNSKGYYYSSETDEEAADVNDYFIEFTTNQINHMVCTKAFGMGIDKSDIRSTYHYVYSSSLESFVQECGRAGRDKKIALSNILLDTTKVYKFDLLSFFNENTIKNRFDRLCLRRNLESKWENGEKKEIFFLNIQDFKDFIRQTDFSFISSTGNTIKPYEKAILDLKQLILDKQDNYLIERYKDRDIHNFFYKKGFKGEINERIQMNYLFNSKEFVEETPGFGEQPIFEKVFIDSEVGLFKFIINEKKIFDSTYEDIKTILNINSDKFETKIKNILKYSSDFEDFLLLLDEGRIIELDKISEEQKKQLNDFYHRDRTVGDTGRLIYRLSTLGLLNDYTFDYNKRFYECTFEKKKSIDEYLKIIESYLRRYLSENTTLIKIDLLKSKLNFTENSFAIDLLECLRFLIDFSYQEIAQKRIRATSEIEEVLLKMLRYEGDGFEKNKFLKEQIYFYFNAKYARPNFTINGNNYSLYIDHSDYLLNPNLNNPKIILEKYLKVFKLEGTEQNNYKHMMGACKKIMQSLSSDDLHNEWVLRLLKAFSMYAMNNISYRSEANLELEKGFINLFEDLRYHQRNYLLLKEIFDFYFKNLKENIDENNIAILDISLIKNKLLQQLQTKGIIDLINQFNSKKNVII
jgi:ATP-dependent DNA helicase RecQ